MLRLRKDNIVRVWERRGEGNRVEGQMRATHSVRGHERKTKGRGRRKEEDGCTVVGVGQTCERQGVCLEHQRPAS